MVDGTFSNISHSSGTGGSSTGMEIDLRPLIIAIRELSASVKNPDNSLEEARPFVVPAPEVTVNEPEQKLSFTIDVPEQAVPTVNVSAPQVTIAPQEVSFTIPVWPLIFIGCANMLPFLGVVVYLILRG